MPKPRITARKTFSVDKRKVQIKRQHSPSEAQPHQMVTSVVVGGVRMTQTLSYGPAGEDTADNDFFGFDQDKAEKLVFHFQALLKTKKGLQLTEDA